MENQITFFNRSSIGKSNRNNLLQNGKSLYDILLCSAFLCRTPSYAAPWKIAVRLMLSITWKIPMVARLED